MTRSLKLFLIIAVLSSVSIAQTIITVKDADIVPGSPYNMTANNIYLLDGFVFVEDGSVLNIEAGTLIKGKEVPTTGDNASAIIISQGGKIFAVGTAADPIIFTAEADDINDPNDLTLDDRGLWGGVIMLGKASVNTTSGTGQIEGIPSNEPRGLYGGGASPDDDDDSGILRYVSIRHCGAEIGAGNEINGLTMGGVGRGTTIEYVEVFANVDDSFEWFGGTVNTKYLVSSFNGDDGFDYDEGYTGNNQFWFHIFEQTVGGGRMGEHDGGTEPEDGTPFALPVIYNATYIGGGTNVNPPPIGDGGEGLIFRDNAGGKYYNSIFTEYTGANGGRAITIEDLQTGADSRERLEQGDLVLKNNIWWGFSAGSTLEAMVPQDFVRTYFTANNNQIVNPQINSISRTNDGNLDPRPNPSGPAGSGAIAPTDPFFETTTYIGAFDPNAPLWINGWTALSATGVTNVQESFSELIPEEFSLIQNYPNPFNPSTFITYALPQSGNVSLKIYDALGKEVTTLVNSFKNAGVYEVKFDASDLTSGVYFYQLVTENFADTKKMILMK